MEKLSFEEVIKKCDYLYVENTAEKTADEVAEELREQIRQMGWKCCADGDTFDDYIDFLAEESPDTDTSAYEESSVSDLEFLCDNGDWVRTTGRDIDWKEFYISFYGIWGQEGVFSVEH